MKKFSALLVIVFVLSMVLAACGVGDSQEVTILTGGSGGTYFPLGAALAQIINDNVDDVQATSIEANASVSNIREVEGQDGDLMLALVQNDIAYYAAEGINMFDESLTNFSGVATLYPEVIQIVTAADSGIVTVDDLRGKRVAVGDVGSGAEANAKQILEAHGISYDDFNAEYMGFSNAADGIQDGNIDAAFITAGTPTGAIDALKVNRDIRVVSLSPEIIASITSEFPYYTAHTLTNAYDTGEDVNTVAVQAMLIVGNNVSEDLVYNMTKAMFENTENFVSAHQGQGPAITLETALDGMSIDLHPGAVRYYEEAR